MSKVVVRLAQSQDLRARQALARIGPHAYFFAAVVHFVLQEATMGAIVLTGAVLFIWFGVSPSMLLFLPPLIATAMAVGIFVQHQVLGEKHAQEIGGEWWGLVAEWRGALLPPGQVPPPAPIEIVLDNLNRERATGYTQIIGTLSVSETQDGRPQSCGRVHCFSVRPLWRGRGVGSSLAGAARRLAARRGLVQLEAVVSELQEPARHMLHKLGWSAAGWWSRREFGGMYSLQLLRLLLPIPHV